MENTLIIGASGGIGAALAAEAAARGATVTTLSRKADGMDLTDEASIAHHLGRLEGPFELIFVATGALVIDGQGPEKSLRALNGPAMAAQFATNAIGPALVLKHALRLLPRDRRAVFAALSARVGSIGDNGLGGWHSYRAAKAALNMLIRGGAIELGRSHRQAIAVCLHPGTVATRFTAGFPEHDKVTPEVAAANLLDVVAGLTVDQSGGFLDFAGRPIEW